MLPLYRARLTLVAALGLATAALVVELPVSQLLRQRSELADVTSQLSNVTGRNRVLSGDVAALREPSTIAAIAHAEYGLVVRGETSYALLPTKGSASASGTLGTDTIAPADLVVPAPTPADIVASATRAAPAAGLWSRVVSHLAFWRWAF